ncbi:hypothetical protein [Vibrio sp. MEBiC08052]|uniref:hypothetical protein n=1 Tax=Vibrio sp. MEBiC08052 TaxID=1761910 RepID=UPI000740731C|nr:hypothetical protein [Vibrio sp. MEBiC08052]KUI99544.1 hypothetical protein VRK_16280 [Vibrio sp. MEBiC08052]
MKKIKILKKSISFYVGLDWMKFEIPHITQAILSEDEKYAAFFSKDEGLFLLELSEKKLKKIDILSGNFYTFEKSNNEVGFTVVLAHEERPEGELFWQHDIDMKNLMTVNYGKKWR